VTHPKVRQALFLDDALKNKRNTAAIEVAPNTLVAARVIAYRPARVQPLEQVKAVLEQKVRHELALQLAKTEGVAKLKELQNSGKVDGLGAELQVSRQAPAGLPPEAVRAVLTVNRDKLPTLLGVDLGAAGYGIYRVNEVFQRDDLVQAERDQAKAQYTQVLVQAENDAMVAAIKARIQAKPIKRMDSATK
jgi:peptidyl-prolyl cis-trans isomerase D